MHNHFIILFVTLSLCLIYLCRKNNFFADYKLEKHKRYSTNLKSYSIGGILLLFFLYYYFILVLNNYYLLIFLSSIFLIGIFSDLKKLNSVSLRFFLQLVIIIFFIAILNLEINSTKIDLIDNILQNKIVNVVFVTFCLMVLVNGGNFIDGLNGLLLQYFLIVFIIINFNFGNYHFVDQQFLNNLIIILSIILIFNLCGFLYMGDSGAYLLSLFTGVYLIEFSFNNTVISPYLIVVFLWYPCFELLFSMIRRSKKDIKTYKPDAYHLHQLVYDFVKTKLKSKNSVISHIYSSFIINLYNFITFIVAVNFIYKSEVLISIVALNILVYVSLYYLLKNKKKYK